MKLHDRLLLDSINDEIHFMQKTYYAADHSDPAKMSIHFERVEKLVSLLDLSLRDKDTLNIGR